jgi:hypothetical protein
MPCEVVDRLSKNSRLTELQTKRALCLIQLQGRVRFRDASRYVADETYKDSIFRTLWEPISRYWRFC